MSGAAEAGRRVQLLPLGKLSAANSNSGDGGGGGGGSNAPASSSVPPSPPSPPTAARFYAAACRAHDLGDVPAALTLYSASLQLEPGAGGVAAWIGRGVAHKTARMHTKAISDYTRALQLAADVRTRLLVLSNRANAYAAQGQVQLSLTDHEQALQLAASSVQKTDQPHSREDALLWQNRASALLRLGRLADARADLQHALSLDPAYALAHYNLGLCAAREGDLAAATAAFEQAARLFAEQRMPRFTDHVEDCHRQIRALTVKTSADPAASAAAPQSARKASLSGVESARRGSRPSAIEPPRPSTPSKAPRSSGQAASHGPTALATPSASPAATPASTPSSRRPFGLGTPSDLDAFTDLPPPAGAALLQRSSSLSRNGGSLPPVTANSGNDTAPVDMADLSSLPMPSAVPLSARRQSSKEMQMAPLGGSSSPSPGALAAAAVVSDAPTPLLSAPSRTQTPRTSVTTFPFSQPSPRYGAAAAPTMQQSPAPLVASPRSNGGSSSASSPGVLSPEATASDPLLSPAASPGAVALAVDTGAAPAVQPSAVAKQLSSARRRSSNLLPSLHEQETETAPLPPA